MLSRLKFLLFVPLLFISMAGLRAQSQDYLKHRKVFDVCSIKKQCRECYTCEQQRYVVKIKNNEDKKITSVSYKFYSTVFNSTIEKDAKIEGNLILPQEVGYLYVCAPSGDHWIISNIIYEDGSSEAFSLKDPLAEFLQDADDCDCND